jgi:putative membrane protein
MDQNMYYQVSTGHHGMMGYGSGGYGGGGWEGGLDGMGILVHLFLFVALVIFIIAVVRYARAGRCSWHSYTSSSQGTQSVLDVIKMRYAKGEIDKVEFDQKKHDLLQ